jgi:hypothetical protein
MFSQCIDASWSPSNVGLDDITHLESSTAWGAKTVKGRVRALSDRRGTGSNKVRLISGRNDVGFSYNYVVTPNVSPPNVVGEMVLEIWNQRVIEVRSRFENLRTVVLIKDGDYSRVGVFEFDTPIFLPEMYSWRWNSRNNLEGYDENDVHKFTWQWGGKQFTIKEDIPDEMLIIQTTLVEQVPLEAILEAIGFDESSYETL